MLAISIVGGVPMKVHDNWPQVARTNGVRGREDCEPVEGEIFACIRRLPELNAGAADHNIGRFAQLVSPRLCGIRAQALWNKRMLEDPTPEDARVVARAPRIEGDLAARRIAEQIESVCRAAV
jgi:hypothetical protein